MSAKPVYEIARYGVRTENEVLIERVQLFGENGELRCRVDDGPEIVCPDTDVVATISADPALSEIRANQVTRITGEPAALQELPFVLRVPGHRDDLDESLWSEAMRDEHTTEWWVQPGVNRVLYVNGERWSAFPTADGDRMLPEGGDDFIRLTPCWGRLGFGESASRTYGLDQAFIGLVTSTAVACATLMDIDPGEDDVVLWRRGNTAMDDARMFVEWLLYGGLVPHYFPGDPGLEGMLAQLFVEASVHGCNGTVVPGSLLAAAAEAELGWGDLDSSEWTLELDLDPAVVEAVLDVLAERSPRLCDIVTAARYPESRAGRAREARLQEMYEPEPEPTYVWDLSAPDNQCASYRPGHLIHWIHFNHSMREPSVAIPVTAAVDDDGLVHIEGDDVSLVRWNHRPALLRDALHRFGGMAVWKPRWHILAVPTEAFIGGARTVFSLAALDEKTECLPRRD
jgi:hypothetical protein